MPSLLNVGSVPVDHVFSPGRGGGPARSRPHLRRRDPRVRRRRLRPFRALDRRRWSAGSEWNRGALMAERVRTVEQGKLQENPYPTIFRAGVPSRVTEHVPFGVPATPGIRKRVTATHDKVVTAAYTYDKV